MFLGWEVHQRSAFPETETRTRCNRHHLSSPRRDHSAERARRAGWGVAVRQSVVLVWSLGGLHRRPELSRRLPPRPSRGQTCRHAVCWASPRCDPPGFGGLAVAGVTVAVIFWLGALGSIAYQSLLSCSVSRSTRTSSSTSPCCRCRLAVVALASASRGRCRRTVGRMPVRSPRLPAAQCALFGCSAAATCRGALGEPPLPEGPHADGPVQIIDLAFTLR